MTQPLPSPKIQPFERLQVQDGLLMNADRWRRAHEYHRQRQNVHYQSLNQPGIVCNLGVRLISAPAEISTQYRDGRWVQIQPGMAIDLLGNIIVVPEPIDFRITTDPMTEEPVMVYIVVTYVDPEKLRSREQREFIKETFRIDEKTNPPGELEVELCRILLQPDIEKQGYAPIQLENPTDVFFPQKNALDLRYRTQARSRPQALVRVAQINPLPSSDLKTSSNLSYLLQSVAALYPALEGADEVGQMTLQLEEKAEKTKLPDYDLLFLTYQRSRLLKKPQWEALENYIKAGGVLLIEVPTEGTNIKELTGVEQELKKAIANFANNANGEESELSAMRPGLEAELNVVQTDLEQEIDNLSLAFKGFAQKIGTPLELLDRLPRSHPLRTQPFLFAALPTINEQPIQLLTGGGIIVIIGNLSIAWGLDETLSIPRETIRTAQEMGINILHFAWRRRQLMQAMQAEVKVTSSPPPTRKEQPRALKNVFDQLE